MSGPAQQFLDDHERLAPSRREERFIALVREHPDALPPLVEGGLRRGLSGRFVGDAISYLSQAAVAPLAALAVRLYAPAGERSAQLDARSASEQVVAQVALQFPRLLHPWLTELFELGVNLDGDYAFYPWRESGELHHAYLLNVVRSSGSGPRASRALQCLLETRVPSAFQAVERHEDKLAHGPYLRQWAGIEHHLPAVGYERAGNRPAPSGWARTAVRSLLSRPPRREMEVWRRLYPEASYHVVYPAGYLPEQVPGWRAHPTFHLDGEGAAAARLGGEGSTECGVCGRRTHHLITLGPVPAGVGVASVPALTLETCLHCVWDNPGLWWKHDGAGRPAPHPGQKGNPDHSMERAPLLETTVRLVSTPARWFWQDGANERQNLARLGGYPCWLQSPEYPSCPDCGRTMPFLFQLDTGPPGDGGETFGDGILFTYWCDACRISVSNPQGT